MKRLALATVGLALALAVAGIVIFRRIGAAGGSELEQWIGRSLVDVVEAHVTPEVEFASLDYQAPYTVVLDGVTLTSAADNVKLVEVGSARLTLARTPAIGQPVQIARIEFEKPALHFRANPGDEGGFVGWSDFVEPRVREGGLDEVEEGTRLSDVLVMRHVSIRDGRIVYDLGEGSDPMVWQGVEANLETKPDPSSPGWYAMQGAFGREPVMSASIDGRIDLDSAMLDLSRVTFNTAVGPEQYEVLPPQIQTFAREHEMRGRLEATASGALAATDWAGGRANVRLTFTDGFFAQGETVWPVERVAVETHLNDRRLETDLTASLLGGIATAEATLDWTDRRPLTAIYRVENIDLRETLRVTSGGSPKYAGRLRASGRLVSQGDEFFPALDGQGTLRIEEGKLVALPVVAALARALSLPFGQNLDRFNDEAVVEYAYRPDRLEIRDLSLATALLGARGDGEVFYDGRLALKVNAGPLEKLENNLGKIGDLLGHVTDRLVTYYVGGTVAEPKVSVQPLGLDFHGERRRSGDR